MSSVGTWNRKASQSRRRRRGGLAITGLPMSARPECLLIGTTPIAAMLWPSPFGHKRSRLSFFLFSRNRDPATGLMCVQSGPPLGRVQTGLRHVWVRLGCLLWRRVFFTGQGDQGDLPRAADFAHRGAESHSDGRDGVSLRAIPAADAAAWAVAETARGSAGCQWAESGARAFDAGPHFRGIAEGSALTAATPPFAVMR